MTIIFDDTDLQDTSVAGGCCCSTEVPAADPWIDDTADIWTSEPEAWDPAGAFDTEPEAWGQEPVAPAVVQPAPEVSQALESVIPAGQPGGPVVDVVDSSSLYPSVAVVGGDPLASLPAADLGQGFVGGTEPLGMTIVPAGGETLANSPTSFTIGAPIRDSAMSSLAEIYGVAAANNDILSQVLVQKTIDAMHHSSAIWASPL